MSELSTNLSAKEVWRAVLGELQLQVPKPTFETWLKRTQGISYNDSIFVVGAPTPFAVEWLERRQYHAIQTIVEKVTQRPLVVQFQVVGNQGPAGNSDYEDGTWEERYWEATDERRPDYVSAARPNLNLKYTFDSFVIGSSNQFAYNAAKAVADAPGDSWNPLFLYSGVGLGKTHLLHAIGHVCASRGKSTRYVTSEQFTNEFISSIGTRTTEEFRERYRSLEVLLIDDVQFLSGKEQTHESFFHTFNDLHSSGNQVVISSDRPPHGLTLLEDRLRSRFQWGLTADIQVPDLETRMAILWSKSQDMGVRVDDSILELIAKRVRRSVRDLEGSLNRMVAESQLMNVPITVQNATRILEDARPEDSRQSINPEDILEAVAGYYGLTPNVLIARGRTRKVSRARQVAMYLLINELEMSPTQVGRFLGGRDHATIIHGAGKISGEINEDMDLRQEVLDIKEGMFS
jgi:chromosomal replication initiator protein